MKRCLWFLMLVNFMISLFALVLFVVPLFGTEFHQRLQGRSITRAIMQLGPPGDVSVTHRGIGLSYYRKNGRVIYISTDGYIVENIHCSL